MCCNGRIEHDVTNIVTGNAEPGAPSLPWAAFASEKRSPAALPALA
jgi:hypothetical protein